jgi:transposase
MTQEEKRRRRFSEAFKKEKVAQLESRKVTVRQLSQIYDVSEPAIYYWIKKYSKYGGKQERMVIEKESEGSKTMSLLKKVADLERLLGQKQVEVEYLTKVIEYGSELTETDIKKKYVSKS